MRKVAFELGDDGSYAVTNYNLAPAFSSFLSGIAGNWGIPAWAYYVNRGQALCTFGVQDKDNCIMEFHSARLHQHRVAQEGFRTFIIIYRDGQKLAYEPFRTSSEWNVTNRMVVRPHELVLEEDNHDLNISIQVAYCTVPDEPFAALARQVKISNNGADAIDCDIVDGFPRLVPYGENFSLLKILPFVTEGYLQVQNRSVDLPFINMRALSSDSWQNIVDPAGHFFMAVDEDGRRLRTIVDPELVFGEIVDFTQPYAMLDAKWDPAAEQGEECQTCCAFVHRRSVIAAGQQINIDALFGRARRVDQVAVIAERFDSQYLPLLRQRNKDIIDSIRHRCFAHGGSSPWNNYIGQTYLDNILRGGLPVTLTKAGGKPVVMNLFGRKHGDLERDYNMFRLDPTCFSQGDGAFRDVNQNRRHDVWFNPDVGRNNVRRFFCLLQLDGFNPLLVHGARWHIADQKKAHALIGADHGAAVFNALKQTLSGQFTPGSVFMALEDAGVTVQDRMRLLETILSVADSELDAGFGEGYWCDHWIYNFDHIDSYLALYPDKLREMLFEDNDYTYYDTDVKVLPRQRKHVLLDETGKVVQVDALEKDSAKTSMISSRNDRRKQVRTMQGKGEVYRCCLAQKIICLITNKLASLSPSGIGLEMDGGRPGWNDSINGIPGIFGSSVSEVVHLLRAVRFIREALQTLDDTGGLKIALPVELDEYLQRVMAAVRKRADDGDDFTCWQACNDAKEKYREAVHCGIDGAEKTVKAGVLAGELLVVEQHLQSSLQRSVDPATGMLATYSRHTPVQWNEIPGDAGRHPLGRAVRITAFEHRFLPSFLEAPTHALNTGYAAGEDAQALYKTVRGGPLYDRELGMYIVCDSVKGEGPEVGRLWAWAPGWFENENVFLHLEHKYLLGCLHAGLYDEFYADLKRCALPFQPPERYGRNPYENASFIMSSRQPKAHYRGRGFQPRSSGTTAEVIEMHLAMSFGLNPFRVDKGELVLVFEPVLADWMFAADPGSVERVLADGTRVTESLQPDSYAALFLGHTMVVYENPTRRPTFGKDAVAVRSCVLVMNDGSQVGVDDGVIRGRLAAAVRDGCVARIICRLG